MWECSKGNTNKPIMHAWVYIYTHTHSYGVYTHIPMVTYSNKHHSGRWHIYTYTYMCIYTSQFSRSVVADSLQPHGLQNTRLPFPSPTPRTWSNSCPLSQWCHPTISSSAIPFSSLLQPFPTSGTSQMSQFLASGGQSTGVSASASVLPMSTQDWSPLGWTSWISLQSKWLWRFFSSTTVWKHQLFSAQLSLWSNSHISIWLLEKP